MRRETILFLMFLFINQLAFSQSQGLYDSLGTARQLMNEKKISEAIMIIRSCEKSYPGNVHVIRLHGQALYWSKDFEATHNYFKASIERYPNLQVLNLDYGRILFELNQLNDAKLYLLKYLKLEPEDAECNLMLGKIAYWQGKSQESSLKYLNIVHKNYPTNQQAIDLIKEVHQNRSPYLKIGLSKYSDSQPLGFIQTSIESGFYQSAWLQPGVQFQNRSFDRNLNARLLEFTNKAAFLKSKTEVLMRVGVFQNSWATKAPYTAGVEIRQKILNDFEITGNIELSPYMNTLRSLTMNVMQTNYTASLGRETGDKFKGKVTFRHQLFEDKNYVQWFSIWTLFPILRTSALKFEIGYAFLAAWSKENRFVLENPEAANTTPTSQINRYPGVYDPYFTPEKQIGNSLLAKGDLKLGSSITISFNANVGVYSKIDYPEFFQYQRRNSQLGGVEKIFTKTKYTPLDLKSTINWRLSQKIILSADYIYFKTIWYDSHTLGAGLKMNFWNDKR